MNETKNLSWSAPEYEHKEQTLDWFWALGVVVVAGSITSVIFKNYFFAIVLILGGILMAIFAIKKPETVNYEINEKGLKIRDRLYPYEAIKSFWVRQGEQPHLFIQSQRLFMPIIQVPVGTYLGQEVREIMLAHGVLEEEMKEHATEKVMDFLGF